MVLTADAVIAEPRGILPVGAIPPAGVKTSGVQVNRLLERTPYFPGCPPGERIARPVALDILSDTLVNLGFGLPSKVANDLLVDVDVFFKVKNGVVGFGAPTEDGPVLQELTPGVRADGVIATTEAQLIVDCTPPETKLA
ncbi:MAG: hypothetical protein NXH97_04955 [Rhodobacteraceae bacterium]|nr:hypothetical protein [Paracoccaceae bacterium]